MRASAFGARRAADLDVSLREGMLLCTTLFSAATDALCDTCLRGDLFVSTVRVAVCAT